MAKKAVRSQRDLRNMRMQQIFSVAIGVIIILSMVISLIVK